MIIVDTALEKREQENKPIRVGLVGAGYMGRGIALQFLAPLAGMRLVAIANRTLAQAKRAYTDAGIETTSTVTNVGDLESAVGAGRYAVTEDPFLLCKAGNIDAIIEATGEIEFGARVVMRAIENGKHVVLMNAELDATLGPILKVHADRAGVVVTNTDGDEPGVAMNLYRFVKTIGMRPVLAGNLKGMIDPYRTPDTQREFAERNKQKPVMITSFADGTKLSMELTVLANATGFRVAKRGMFGHRCAHIKDALKLFPLELFRDGGLVDYVLGAEPHTGAFVIGLDENPIRRQYLDYFKMGEGPLYVFYTPYHLPHVQIATTVARAVLFQDATVAPQGKPVCEVLTVAKRDLKAGELLDGIGGFTCYGVIENAEVSRKGNLLPMGFSDGCRLKADIARDRAIAYSDVELPAGRYCDRLKGEQNARFDAP
ncbi:MAG: Gfo/Idh/MocA family oxidoreductase [Deltaproteobacteria bacterium]|nr:Gfo/Idh/MocA family oxidoreductase [Deltaproteobacteria bacterium]